jgi:hypothetical protein
VKLVCVLTLGMLVGPGSEVVINEGFPWEEPRPARILITGQGRISGTLFLRGWNLDGIPDYRKRCYSFPTRHYLIETRKVMWRNVRRLCLPGCNGDS